MGKQETISYGPIAQLGARLNGIEEVESSNLSGSTKISVFPGAFWFYAAIAQQPPDGGSLPVGRSGARRLALRRSRVRISLGPLKNILIGRFLLLQQ